MIHLVVHLNRLDNLFIRLQQRPYELFFLHDLNVSNDRTTGNFGLVEVLLYFGTFLDVFVFTVDVLFCQFCIMRVSCCISCRSGYREHR